MAQCWYVSDFPKEGESLNSYYCSQEYGGKGLNVALGAARLGAQVQLSLGLGQDSAAQSLKNRLRLEKNLSFQSTTHEFTGLSGQGAGWINAKGANQIVVYSGANARLSITEAKKDQTNWQNYSAIYAQFESHLAYSLAIFAHAKARQQRTILNPSPWRTPDVLFERILGLTDILIVNQTEWAQLCTYFDISDDPHHAMLADKLWQKWQGKALIVTRGAEGAQVFRPHRPPLSVAGFEVVVKDTVGAGDAFIAALCAAGLGEMDLDSAENWQQILTFGHAAGAYLAAHIGVFEVLPTRAELTKFLENIYKKTIC